MKQGKVSPRAGAPANELQRSIEVSSPVRTRSKRSILKSWSGLTIWTQPETFVCSVRRGLPPILCLVLVSLGIDTIRFTYFVRMKNTWLHAWAVAALTGGVALILYTIVVLDRPFGRGLR